MGRKYDHLHRALQPDRCRHQAPKTRPLDAAKKLLADIGGEMKQFYMVMGDCDFVGIYEAPDDAVMARYALQLGGLGFVRTKTLKAFPETAYREIIRLLG
jgi:uncharacterized protein with GYD domain